ncbi:MAG: hypothetical protein H6620_05705 [Halobacteriovoraceae bacterium]|nr:hypothetical protein [Halobacteriovoraceae bacterium]
MKLHFFSILVPLFLFSCKPAEENKIESSHSTNQFEDREIASVDQSQCLKDFEDQEDKIKSDIESLNNDAKELTDLIGQVPDSSGSNCSIKKASLCDEYYDVIAQIHTLRKDLKAIEVKKTTACLSASGKVKVLCPGTTFPSGSLAFYADNFKLTNDSVYNPTNVQFEEIHSSPTIRYDSSSAVNTVYGTTPIPTCHYKLSKSGALSGGGISIKLDSKLYFNCEPIIENGRPGFLCEIN